MPTLLLADDSVTIQRVIELTFADEDIQVVAVSDGDQAIAHLEKSPPDIVLADVGMPGKTGYEVAEYIKRSPKLQHIPVVLLTGAFEPVDQDKAAQAGCDGVLAKPFEPQLVIGRVRELLSKPKQQAPATLGAPKTSFDEPFAAAAAKPAVPIDDYFDRLDAAFANLSTTPLGSKPAEPSAAVADSIDWFGLKTTATTDPTASSSPEIAFDPAPGLAEPPTPSVFESEPAFEIRKPVPPADHPEPPPLDLYPMPQPDPAPVVPQSPVREPQPELAPVVPQSPVREPQPELAPVVLQSPVREPQPEPSPVVLQSPVREPQPEPAPALLVATPDTLPASPAHAAASPVSTPPATLPPLADAFALLLAAEQHEPPPGAAAAWPTPGAASGAVDLDALADQVADRVLKQLSDRVVRERVDEIVSKVAERLVRDEIERIKSTIK